MGVERGRFGRTGVLIGECRTEIPFTERDVTKLEVIATRLRAAGFDCYALFATLNDAFYEEEVGLFIGLRDRERYGEHVIPRPPILLTRADLEHGDFARGDLLERPHLGKLAGMAKASDRLYLRES